MWIKRHEKYYQGFGTGQCARCGIVCDLTIDHFIPKSCKMDVDKCGNYVGLCRDCNQEKGNRIVTPDWYLFLDPKRKENLIRYMRYARSYIREHTNDQEVIDYLDSFSKS